MSLSKMIIKVEKTINNTKYNISIEAEGDYTEPIFDFLHKLELNGKKEESTPKNNSVKSASVVIENTPTATPLDSGTLKYGKVTVFNTGAVYEVFVYSNVNSFNDFVSEIPYGVVKVICKNKNISEWTGISKLPKSVTSLDVSGCLFKTLEGELSDTNINELYINSCKIVSLKGINKTKIDSIELTNNPYSSKFDKRYQSNPIVSVSQYIAQLKKKYDEMELDEKDLPGEHLPKESASKDVDNSKCMYKCNNIFDASNNKCLDCIKKFKDHINDVDKNDHTPLHIACMCNCVERAKLLIENGSFINKQNKYGTTPLHNACFATKWDCVDLLIKYCADTNVQNDDGDTPFHAVCSYGEEEYIKRFISYGANIYIKNKKGVNPLEYIRNKNLQQRMEKFYENCH